MSQGEDFDGYRKWLGITPRRRSPSHYDVLGVNLNEDDHEVIQSAAEQRRRYVESKRGFGRDDQVSEILMRIDEAEITLLNFDLRREYDRQQQLFEKRRKSRQVDPNVSRTGFESKPGRVVGEDYEIVKTYAGIVAILCIAFAGMALFAFNILTRSKPISQVEPVPAAGPPAGPVQVPVAPPMQNQQVPPVATVVLPQDRSNLVDVITTNHNSSDLPRVDLNGFEESKAAVPVIVPVAPRHVGTPSKEIILLKDDSLSEWESSPAGDKSKWSLKNGTLRLIASGSSLMTKQKFRDFDLHLEFKLPPKCNSGVYLRGRYEVQLLDSQFRDKAGQPAPPNGRCGAIWGKIAPNTDAYKGANQWNTLDVRLVGREVTVRLNDSLVIDSQTIDGVTRGGLDANEGQPGPILLQKSDVVGPEFRNIRIQPIGDQIPTSQAPRAGGQDRSNNSTSQTSPKFVPPKNKCLLIIGQDKPAVDTYVREIGHQPAGVMTYDHISYLGLDEATALRRSYPQAIMQIGLEFKGSMKEIPGGRFDANIEKLANWAMANPEPIYLRPGYECDGAHNQYPPDEYVKAFRYLRDKLDQRGVQNIAYVWHVLPGNQPIEKWWPGDQYVDWVAITYFAAQKQNMAPVAGFAKKHGKPLMLAEAAPRGIGTVQGKRSWDIWFRPCFEDIAQYDVRALCYINWDWESKAQFRGGGWGDTRVQGNAFVKSQWLKEVSKARYKVTDAELRSTQKRP